MSVLATMAHPVVATAYSLCYTPLMTLSTADVQAIKGAVSEIVDARITTLEKRIDARWIAFEKRMDALRADQLEGFKKQSEYLSKAIADAVHLVAASHATKEEVQELRAEVEDLKDRLQKLEQRQKTA